MTIGRLDRLASLFEAKLQSLAVHPSFLTKESQLKDAAKKIEDCYKARVISKKYNTLRILEGFGDLFSKSLIEDMGSLVSSLDKLVKGTDKDRDLFLLEMANIKSDIINNRDRVKQEIMDSWEINRESDRNRLKQMVYTFLEALAYIERIFKEVTEIIEKYCSPAFVELTHKILSGKIEPVRKALNKDQILTFSRTFYAKKYGIDSLDILERLLRSPAIREKLTTVINAVNRGKIPKDGPAILEEAQKIAEQIGKETPNIVHEIPEEDAQEAFKAKLDPAEQWSHEMNEQKKYKAKENAEEFPGLNPEVLDKNVEKRDKEWEERMMSKYNSASLYKFLRKV